MKRKVDPCMIPLIPNQKTMGLAGSNYGASLKKKETTRKG